MTGSEFKQRRLWLGLTQDHLAKEFGVSRVTISTWENLHEGSVPRVTALAMEAISRIPSLRTLLSDGIDLTKAWSNEAA
jgi:DNA-binding XRE family transcriptional regulator